ncbi:hypothetical protein BGZ76_006931 [Entomortierella beljakovae]|nr:hypothetical protein BGZ76_006931 [Entomortierella beljakovae]
MNVSACLEYIQDRTLQPCQSLAGTIEGEDRWTKLFAVVVELDEVENDRRNAAAASKKRLALQWLEEAADNQASIVASVVQKQTEAMQDASNRRMSALATTIATSAQIQREALQAATNRQVSAIEALAACSEESTNLI